MSDKSIGKKWGKLKRAARGSVKSLSVPSPVTRRNSSFEAFEDEVAEDEFGERQLSSDEKAKISKVCSLIENFRLQCPQTHAGLVVAFTSTTLSPLNDPGIKFKWYRMGGGVNNDQFLQIDESPRAWYPPTADDIGKKICANCEDNFGQGFCHYSEAGPVEADPLLISMVESALENGRYEVKDISFSVGTKSLDPCDTRQNEELKLHSFDMSSSERPTSLVSTDAMTYPFLQFPENISLEVNYQGIFINTMNAAGSTTRRGMNILPSENLEMFCTLPASFVVVVELPNDLKEMLMKKNNRRNNKNSFSDSDDSEGESDVGDDVKVKGEDEKTEDLLGLGNNDQSKDHEQNESGYEWIGYSKIDDAANGTGSEKCMLLDSFLTTLPGGTTHFRVCFAFADRMSRDAFALSCRVLAGIKPGAGYRDRLRSLPWFSEDGDRRTVEVQSIAGNDLGRRLKELEDENAQLRRQQNELNVQLVEQSEFHPSVSVASVSDDSEEQSGTHQAVSQLRTKLREVEKEVSSYKQKELEWEKSTLEMEGRIKRIQADGEAHTETIAELHQRISESQAEAGAMRVLSEKYQAEMETIKAELDSEVKDNRANLENELETLRKEISETTEEMKNASDILNVERDKVDEQKRIAEDRLKTINELQDQMLCMQTEAAEARNMRERFDELREENDRKLSEVTAERDAALAEVGEKEKLIEVLRNELDQKDILVAQLESEKETLLSDSVAPDEYLAMEEKAIRLEGEKNQQEKMTRSLQKDMKKVVKELQHQIWVLEEELSRSNERCNELKSVMTQMADDELKRVEEEEQKRSKSGLMGKMKSMKRLSMGPGS